MDLVLDPPRGVAPLRLGMTLDEAVAAVSGWGEPRVLRRPGRNSAKVSASLDGVGVQALLEGGPAVTAVELWWPGEGRESATRVLLHGDDVFRTPAVELFRRAALRGRPVDTSRPEHPVIPGVSLGFTRQTSQEVPRDAGGLPVYVTSVHVGGRDYYDHLRADRG
ncbi:hypothetical protein GCM10010503_44710 [Streptomyces lucensis JCM 4490]|uniref:Uncharacterized protein n=1 Tax=Streptomyces lucensis JCM 4490 TaxID=1306176 RepID=A0A918J8V0_9ACTN|nr:hypothetical protein [Streptomyces lucensis]GGW62460.1 hypothetical protein GCM10010503_44710 [Streptomyces lucensis JCM 4490]